MYHPIPSLNSPQNQLFHDLTAKHTLVPKHTCFRTIHCTRYGYPNAYPSPKDAMDTRVPARPRPGRVAWVAYRKWVAPILSPGRFAIGTPAADWFNSVHAVPPSDLPGHLSLPTSSVLTATPLDGLNLAFLTSYTSCARPRYLRCIRLCPPWPSVHHLASSYVFVFSTVVRRSDAGLRLLPWRATFMQLVFATHPIGQWIVNERIAHIKQRRGNVTKSTSVDVKFALPKSLIVCLKIFDPQNPPPLPHYC
ncbi:hypothetical protein OG21DRAFT_684912 [Imleria badia]|nr:hypothetical protein OG21DRAFT_684912 [Imleria badia]